MRARHLQTKTTQRAATAPTGPRELGLLARAASMFACVVVLVGVLDLLGLVRAGDEAVQRRWFHLIDTLDLGRSSNEKVVLVTDASGTLPPKPWSADVLLDLVDTLERGHPTLIATVGLSGMFESDAAGKLLRELDAIEAGERAKPDAARMAKLRRFRAAVDERFALVDETGNLPWKDQALVDGDLIVPPGSRFEQIIARTALPPPNEGRLAVHWLLPAKQLPEVPIDWVLGGDLPLSNFQDKIVLIGVTQGDFVAISTPAGPLSAAQIEAHALIGLSDGVVWYDPPPALLWLIGLIPAVLLSWLLHRTGGRVGLLLALLVVVAVFAADWLSFSSGTLRLGVTRPLLLLVLSFAGYWALQAWDTVAGLGLLHARVLSEAGADRGESEVEEAAFWDDLAELGKVYAEQVIEGAASCTVVERLEGWSLRVRASAGLDKNSHEKLLAERELDMRRAPFRPAWLTLRAHTTRNLLPSGPSFGARKTLLIPLQVDGELLGVWMVHLLEEIEISETQTESFETLGRQMAASILRRRERAALRDQGTHKRLRDRLDTILGGLRMLRGQQRWALELLEQLPMRALISTVWGEIEYVDPRLRQSLAQRYPGLFNQDGQEGAESGDDLRAVLARLTGKTLDEAHRLMRRVVQDGVELELETVRGIDDDGSDVWVLTRVKSKRGIDLPGFKPAVHEHIVLMARSSVPAQRVRTRSGGWLRVLGGSLGD
jgi:CHASE2 domain-containing sensor protein